MTDMIIRDADGGDAEAVAEIYAFHVANGVATYDTEAPGPVVMAAKIAAVAAAGWPFLVIELAGEVAGYAYATQMRDRAAYRHTCEDSIYIRAGSTRQGLGHALLDALLQRCAAADFHQMIAVIGGAEPASIALHAASGFRPVGRLTAVGFKFGRWLDSVYMQRALP